jgi:hypothetical protein
LQPSHAGSKSEYPRGAAGDVGGDDVHAGVIEEVPHQGEHVFAGTLRVEVVWKMSSELRLQILRGRRRLTQRLDAAIEQQQLGG